MGKMLYIGSKCKNQKKKPGWREAAAEETAWLKKINEMTAFSSNKYKGRVSTPKTKSPVVDGTVPVPRPKEGSSSLGTFGGAGTKKVFRPEIQYKEDPELLARELKARERKFATAPVFNKGGPQYISEEIDADLKKGLLRRR